MRDPEGVSRGSGFVAFSTSEEASRAVSLLTLCRFRMINQNVCDGLWNLRYFVTLQLTEMNGKMVVSKPLYVALAQRKEERRARLQV